MCPYEFEIWKTICLFDYDFLSQGATDLGNVLMISLDKLLLMKALDMDNEQYLADTKLVVQRILATRYERYEQRRAENEMIVQAAPRVSYLEKTGPDQ